MVVPALDERRLEAEQRAQRLAVVRPVAHQVRSAAARQRHALTVHECSPALDGEFVSLAVTLEPAQHRVMDWVRHDGGAP